MENEKNALFNRALDAIKSNPEQYGLMAVPFDIDETPWNIGDRIDFGFGEKPEEVVGIGPSTLYYYDEDTDTIEWTHATNKRHYTATTVEDVLYNALKQVGAVDERTPEFEEWLHEQANRLRLAIGADNG